MGKALGPTRAERLIEAVRREPALELVLNHLRVVWQLNGGPGARLTAARSKATTQYLRPYVGMSFNHVQRRQLLLFQTDHLTRLLDRAFFHALARSSVSLWRSEPYSIEFAPADGIEGEGSSRQRRQQGRVPLQLRYVLDFARRRAAMGLVSFLLAQRASGDAGLDAQPPSACTRPPPAP